MKLRHKLLWVLIVTALLGAASVGFGATWVVGNAVRENFSARIRAETASIALWAQRHAQPDPQQFAEQAAAGLGVRVTLIDERGVVLGDSARSRENVPLMDNHLDRPEIRLARTAGSGESVRQSGTTNVEYFYSARRTAGDGPIRYVRLALPVSDVEAVQGRYAWTVASVVLLVMLLIATVAYAAVRRLSMPVERMSEAADRIAAGELALEVPARGRDEVARLAAAVNRMKHALLAKVGELRGEHALLSSVVSDMQEGLLLVGPDRRVRLANRAALEIFDLDFDPTGHLLAEIVRHPVTMDVVSRALKDRAEVRESVLQLPVSGRSYELHATPLAHGDGVIVLIFDITRLEALEGVRREFVANVSHELRTPLTSIKAFVETLVDGGLDDRDNALEFLRIISKHTERMEALIDDLTDLSRIETGAVELELSTVDVARVADEVVAQLGPAIERRRVRVRVELPRPFTLRADRRRLEQVLTNLVDNAVKFNRPGGEVRVRGRLRDGRPEIVVEDTGIGIPADSLDSVFHRFFRVDPPKSREAGGTGLGLAIVKHLMRLHEGKVRVESELGVGSRFILEFPSPGSQTGDIPPLRGNRSASSNR